MITFSIKQLFPAFILADPNGYALARAIEAGMNYFLARIREGLEILTDADKMPEWRLDELAWEYNVTWYDSTATLEEKRQTIKDARDIYARLGTPDAVVKAVNGVFGYGRIEEWWEYDGDPFHFRVYSNDASAMAENYRRFTAIINVVKNVRSYLDGVYYVGQQGIAPVTALAGVAGILQTGLRATAYGGYVEEVEIVEEPVEEEGTIVVSGRTKPIYMGGGGN